MADVQYIPDIHRIRDLPDIYEEYSRISIGIFSFDTDYFVDKIDLTRFLCIVYYFSQKKFNLLILIKRFL